MKKLNSKKFESIILEKDIEISKLNLEIDALEDECEELVDKVNFHKEENQKLKLKFLEHLNEIGVNYIKTLDLYKEENNKLETELNFYMNYKSHCDFLTKEMKTLKARLIKLDAVKIEEPTITKLKKKMIKFEDDLRSENSFTLYTIKEE